MTPGKAEKSGSHVEFGFKTSASLQPVVSACQRLDGDPRISTFEIHILDLRYLPCTILWVSGCHTRRVTGRKLTPTCPSWKQHEARPG